MREFPVAANLVKNLCHNKWGSWEEFGLTYEALLMTMYGLQDEAQVSLFGTLTQQSYVVLL